MISKITVEEALKLEDAQLIDARSPKEYEEDHLEGAVNIPLLDNDERHEIGTIYKQISRDLAIEKGLTYYAKKIPTIFKTIEPFKNKKLVIYCARGGMRSGIIASLLDSIGLEVYQIEGGYKLFRHWILDQYQNITINPEVYILYGLTCTGKTELLKRLPNVIDLEALAQHRGSLYGAIGLTPNSQKRFENLLLQKLKELNDKPFILLEGESRKVGNSQIPEVLWEKMKNGKKILIKRSLELRCQAMVDEYFINPKIVEEIKSITKELRRVISNENKEKIIELVEKKQFAEAARILFVEYYDPLYEHELNKMNFELIVDNKNFDEAAKIIKDKISC